MKVKELFATLESGTGFVISNCRNKSVLVQGYVDVIYTDDILEDIEDFEVGSMFIDDDDGRLVINISYTVDYDALETCYKIKVLDIATNIIAPFEQYESIEDVEYDIKQWTKDAIFSIDKYGNVYDECGDKIND